MKNHRSRRSRDSKRYNRYVLVCAFIAVFAIALAATGIFTHANEKDDKVYTSIEIAEGDTLWNIACDNYNSEEESIQEYIDNVKKINNMSSDRITSGNYLIIYRNN